MFEALLEFLIEVVGELLLEVLIAVGWESLSAAFQRRSRVSPTLACFGYVILGSALGMLSGWQFPTRLIGSGGLAVLSLFVNPLVSATLMHFYGGFRRRNGRSTTHLATFVGGLTLALGVSLGRVFVVRFLVH
ncbi:MAG: hypothetical protein QM756_01915 [Polyangiaceae bacterium]